jgi:alkylated DNA repair dioxygenase AlkB
MLSTPKRRRSCAVPVCKADAGTLELPGASGFVTYVPEFLSASESSSLFEMTLQSCGWERTPIRFFGKAVLQPRDTCFYGTADYSYSDDKRSPISWDADASSAALYEVKLRIEAALDLPVDFFNVALCNKYHSGTDYMGFHSDDEKTMGKTPVIASLSVGAQRRFLLREKTDDGDGRRRVEYLLDNGSLLVMSGETQKYWKHSLPRQAGVDEPRLNYTFRRVVSDGDSVCPDERWRPPSLCELGSARAT